MRANIMVTSTLGLIGLMALFLVTKFTKKKHNLEAKEVPDHAAKAGFPEGFYDLTIPVNQHTLLFPGDPVFKAVPCCSLEKDGFNLSRLEFGNHTGTHVDFYRHVDQGGKTSSDYKLQDLIGDGLIIHVPDEARSIDEKFVKQKQSEIFTGAFVFFKTANSHLSKVGKPVENYVYIEPAAAQALLDMKVKVVGIDYISVDPIAAEDLPVHKILLKGGALIVENLDLGQVNPGKCQIFIIPPKIENMDGLPARVFAKM